MEGASRYQLQRASRSSGPFTTVSSFIRGESRVVTRLLEGTEYWFQVRARGDGETLVEEWGPYSAVVPGSTLSHVEAPEGVETDPESISSITVSWDEMEGASRYQLQRASSSSGPFTTVSSFIRGESRVVTRLSEGTEYWFQVRARGDGETLVEEWGPYSAVVPGSTLSHVEAPEGVETDPESISSITVSWDEMEGASRYQLQRGSSSGPWNTVSSSITGESRLVTRLSEGTEYWFQVRARGDGETLVEEWGPYSAAVPGRTLSHVEAPEGVDTDPESISSITVSWDEMEGASRYQLQRASSSSGPFTTVSSFIGGESRLVTRLSEGTEYWFQVRAYGDGETLEEEWGPYSAVVPGSTLSHVEAPEGVETDPESISSITVSWDEMEGASRYQLQRGSSSSGPGPR